MSVIGSIIGIDPGTTGALSVLSHDAERIAVYDIPRLKLKKGTRNVAEVDCYAFARLLDDIVSAATIKAAWIERVGTMPTDAKTAAFAFGMAYGMIRGVLCAHFIPLNLVTPMQWRRTSRLNGGKDAAREKAQQLWPLNRDFQRVKDHNRAESALIAWHGWTQHQYDNPLPTERQSA